MKKAFFVLFVIALKPLFLFGQDTAQLKRLPHKLVVFVDKRTVYEENLIEAPFIHLNNTVQIYPGETVFIEIEEADGIIKNMTAVKEIKDASKTLTISFTQTANKKAHESMMLKVTNPFKYKLIYKAIIFILSQKKWINTNVYPVEPGLSGFEIWPDIITSIGLNSWTFQTH